MAYFSNGAVGGYHQAEHCARCLHGPKSFSHVTKGPCPIMALHVAWNDDAVGANADETKATALNTLWPVDENGENAECAMFVEFAEI